MIFPKLFVFLVSVWVTETQLVTNLETSSILKELTQRLELTEAQVKDLKLENEGDVNKKKNTIVCCLQINAYSIIKCLLFTD